MRTQQDQGLTMQQTVTTLRTGKEKTYGALMIGFGALLWVAIIAAAGAGLTNPKTAPVIGVYIGYAVAIWLFIVIAAAAYRATAFGNMILLGPKQFPKLHAMVVAGSNEIGLSEPPKTFLYNSNGIFNAFARRLRGGRYVFLTSALVDADSDAQVRFVIGHELGHHAAGHLNPWMNALKLPAHFVPFLGRAYSRAREATCDNIGCYISKDFAVAQTSLQMLGCGCRRLNAEMNCEAFMEQEEMVPSIFGFLTEIFRSHPRLTRRVAAINVFFDAQRENADGGSRQSAG
jgi:Zn-dependent protease with chaperone function